MSGLRIIRRKCDSFRNHPYTHYILIKTAILKGIYHGKISKRILPDVRSISLKIPKIEIFKIVTGHPLGHGVVKRDVQNIDHIHWKMWDELKKTYDYLRMSTLFIIMPNCQYVYDILYEDDTGDIENTINTLSVSKDSIVESELEHLYELFKRPPVYDTVSVVSYP